MSFSSQVTLDLQALYGRKCRLLGAATSPALPFPSHETSTTLISLQVYPGSHAIRRVSVQLKNASYHMWGYSWRTKSHLGFADSQVLYEVHELLVLPVRG